MVAYDWAPDQKFSVSGLESGDSPVIFWRTTGTGSQHLEIMGGHAADLFLLTFDEVRLDYNKFPGLAFDYDNPLRAGAVYKIVLRAVQDNFDGTFFYTP